ncbi:hypothetical protein [Pseudoalteromonas arabiensis]|uniref:hypothetical protein n=1 Tax=Pseudoalteromonas arabiensis TaxID=874454 RepID=UPI0007823F82|nr:hypothetical protein [Pseudoalteromonas arabiensis]
MILPTIEDFENAKEDLDNLSKIVNSQTQVVVTRTGAAKKTLAGLEANYLMTAINGGLWEGGQTFTAYNQYMVHNGIAYKPKAITTLPYTVSITPDHGKVEVTGGLTKEQSDKRYSLIFENVATLKAFEELAAGMLVKTQTYYVGTGGGANYLIVTSINYGATPDGDFDFYVGSENNLVAVLIVDGVLNLAQGGFIPAKKEDWSDFFEAAFAKSKTLYSKFVAGKFLISRPLNIPLDGKVDLNLCKLGKTDSFISNNVNTIIQFTGSNGVVAGIDGSDVVAANEKLIGFNKGIKNCRERNCRVPLSRFLRNEGVLNDNVSETLNSLVPQYGENSRSRTKKVKMQIDTSKTGGSGDFRRVRYIPSIMRLTHVKVTDTSGSPDFSFEVIATQGDLRAIYSKARGGSNIDQAIDLDYIHEDFDDVLQLRLISYGAVGTTFDIELTYEYEQRCNEQVAWFYSSEHDFLKPHKSNALTHALGVRGAEYRCYINGLLKVTNITPLRKKNANHNWPYVTVPVLAGTRDASKTTELKFYLNYSAAQALRDGVTHLKVRLQDAPAIKCTVINGWLSQAYDDAPNVHLSTLGEQPSIEVDISQTSIDESQGYILMIPLDRKAMQQGALQMQANDFNFFYLTFYQNLTEHLPIEWNDEWSFQFEFIRQPELV